jgi:16S rRNA (guanine1207-N2)-methyltransferase
MSHYFTTDNTEHDFREITFSFSEKTFKFKTDRGVFSKERVDYGSEVLLKGIIKDDCHLEGCNMIDMGAGYGPIGIVLGALYNIQPLMIEVNEDALNLIGINLEKNGVSGETLSRERYEKDAGIKTELYVTNPPFRAGKQVVLDMIEDAANRLVNNGLFYMVVQKKQGMPSYKKALQETFGHVEIVLKDKGYYVLKSQK